MIEYGGDPCVSVEKLKQFRKANDKIEIEVPGGQVEQSEQMK